MGLHSLADGSAWICGVLPLARSVELGEVDGVPVTGQMYLLTVAEPPESPGGRYAGRALLADAKPPGRSRWRP